MQFCIRYIGLRTSNIVQRKGGVRGVDPVCVVRGIQGRLERSVIHRVISLRGHYAVVAGGWREVEE